MDGEESIPTHMETWDGRSFAAKPIDEIVIGDLVSTPGSTGVFLVTGRDTIRDLTNHRRPRIMVRPAGTLFHPAWRYGVEPCF